MSKVYKLTDDDKEFLSKLPITNEQLVELFKFMNEYEGEYVYKGEHVYKSEDDDEKEETEKLN